MSVREYMSKHPRITVGVTLGACTLAIAYLVFSMLGSSQVFEPRKAWFTDDDGKTWFAADAAKKPPFNHNGKQAVMCFVYSHDGGKSQWISYMLRYAPSAKQKIEERAKQLGISEDKIEPGAMPMEVKKPGTGEAGWINTQDARASSIMELRAPDGSRGGIVEVDPN